MSSAERFEVFPCSFVHAGGTLNLPQLESCSPASNSRISAVRIAGAIDPQAHLLAGAKPMVQLGTRDLATFFGTVSPTLGLKCTGAVTFRLYEREDCGAFLTGATHVTVTSTGGFLYPDAISADQESEEGALCRAMYVPLWDGTNDPLIVTDAVDFSAAPTPTFTSRYFLGPVYSGGSEVKGVTNATANFGLTVAPSPQSPGPYDRKLAITSRNPTLTFDTLKADAAAGVDFFLRSVSGGSFAMYFQKGTDNGDRVAVGTASHVKVSCTAGGITTEEIGGSKGQDAILRTTVRPTGTISLSTASTIP